MTGGKLSRFREGPEVIKLLSSSTQLSMEFYLLITSKSLISTVVFLLSSTEYEFLCLWTLVGNFIFISRENFMLSWRAWKKFYNLRARVRHMTFKGSYSNWQFLSFLSFYIYCYTLFSEYYEQMYFCTLQCCRMKAYI